MEDQDMGEDFSVEILSNRLGEAWPSLATQLGFDDAECQSIIVAHEGRVSRQAHYMLQAWIERNGGTLEMSTLIEALKEIRRPDFLRELGVEILDNETILRVAQKQKVQESWPELALYLGFNIEDCQNIQKSFPRRREQARQMLAHWRVKFNGANPLETLAKALQAVDIEVANELGTLQRIPPCTTLNCGNSDPVKFRRYFSQDGKSQLLGICCTMCGQEWLQDRFLFHPDTDKTRPRIRLYGVVLKKQLKVAMDTNPAFLVMGSRKKIDLDNALDILKVGDHITWQRPYILWHHAIVTGVDKENGLLKVIHWNKMKWSCGTTQIMETDISLGDQWGANELYQIEYGEEMTKANPIELVNARAKSRLRDTGYELLGDNCEAFASYCKIGVMESCQTMWVYNKVKTIVFETLVNAVKGVVKGYFVAAKEYVKAGSKAFLQQDGTVSVEEGLKAVGEVGSAELFERLCKGTDVVGAGIVIVIEGVACVWNLGECYQQREKGDLSMREFVKTATQLVVDALCAAGLAVSLGVAGHAGGAALGAAAVTFTIPGIGTAIGGFIGSIVGGAVGSLVGRAFGSFIGAPIGHCLARQIGTDDSAVRIEELLPGDQIVSYGNLLHPRHHAIVVSRSRDQSKVRVVHSTYGKGVVEEEVDFIEPVYKVIYREQNCFPPEKVIERARSKIVDDAYTYSLVWNNCKHFAQWCKLKE
ncbi:uncharacterized protein [Asterias amurensis]|uniref:uncharacterized protein n=1 Tax=Asterias amurensis TaxID=7602 RepID=UPI003AB75BA5